VRVREERGWGGGASNGSYKEERLRRRGGK